MARPKKNAGQPVANGPANDNFDIREETGGELVNRLPDAPQAKVKGKAPKVVNIPQVRTQLVEVRIKGRSPLIVRAWDQKTMQQLADKQAGKKAAKSREAEDPNEVFNGARYISTDGWDGIPAGAFKAALVQAVSTMDLPIREFNMTLAKMTLFVLPDGIDKASGRDLVRIYGPEPEVFALMQPTSGGGPYMSYRPRFKEWSVNLRVQYNPLKIDKQGVLNLIAAAGYFVGVGEHRPSAKECKTGTSGLWELDDSTLKFDGEQSFAPEKLLGRDDETDETDAA